VMLLNPNNASGRLILWTGGERDYGVVVAMDGSVAGFVRFGQFLGGAASELVIRQLIDKGKVERAILGVRLTELRNDSPVRQTDLTLGDRPALAVDEVSADSLAAKAGIQAGDLLLEIDAQPVGDLTTFSALSARGGKVKVLILRKGEEKTLEVDLQPDHQR
jgi:S1-C subfamily serine protease